MREHSLASIDDLKQHEQIDANHLVDLIREIRRDGWVTPILVDRVSLVVLDGHHRYNALKALGYRQIPVFFVDYAAVQLSSWRSDLKLTKEEIVLRAERGELYPPKTSRHIVADLPVVRVPLRQLDGHPLVPAVADDALALIGLTPMVRIKRLNPNPAVTIFAKLEGQNPGGSVKDRIALWMIEAAEKSGELTHDKTILEPTSGNTGIGLAMVAAVKGYKATLVMSAGMSEERKRMLKALGAELVETDPSKGTDGAILKAREMLAAEPDRYWMPDQFSNPNNPGAHYETTAVEILDQVPEITTFVAGMGTSGTLMGLTRRFREYHRPIKVVGVEPQSNHKIAGLKNMGEAIVPAIYDENILDEKVVAFNEDAYRTARELALREGLLVGMSAGAAMWAALEQAKTMTAGTIVVLFPDRGEKYLSTQLFVA